jgi:5-methylcytosine-specific restriction endonuclease McrA
VPTSARHQVVTPLAPERYKVQLTVNRATYEKLRRAQDLLRHRVPNGDPAEIFDYALTVLVEKLEREKCATTDAPRRARPRATRSRHIPAAIKRAVWTRDGGQCAFVGRQNRCTERGFLEFHHVHPHAAGGEPTVENIELRCRSHNIHDAEQFFGASFARESAVRDSSGTPASTDGAISDVSGPVP